MEEHPEERLEVGQVVGVSDGRRGRVAYLGPLALPPPSPTPGASGSSSSSSNGGEFVGLDFGRAGAGRNDGQVFGHRYFTARNAGSGSFFPRAAVEVRALPAQSPAQASPPSPHPPKTIFYTGVTLLEAFRQRYLSEVPGGGVGGPDLAQASAADPRAPQAPSAFQQLGAAGGKVVELARNVRSEQRARAVVDLGLGGLFIRRASLPDLRALLALAASLPDSQRFTWESLRSVDLSGNLLQDFAADIWGPWFDTDSAPDPRPSTEPASASLGPDPIRDMLAGVEELNLSMNLFAPESFPLAPVGSGLARPHALGKLRALILNSTLIPWPQIEWLLNQLPLLQELYLAYNGLEGLHCSEPSAGPPWSLRRLDLTGNSLRHWSSLLPTISRRMPLLERLVLAGNGLGDLGPGLGLDQPLTLPALTALTVSDNSIGEWATVDSWGQLFPKLADLRFQRNPVLKRPLLQTHTSSSSTPASELSEPMGRAHVLARLGGVRALNGARISDEERVEAEKQYLGRYLGEALAGQAVPEVEALAARFSGLSFNSSDLTALVSSLLDVHTHPTLPGLLARHGEFVATRFAASARRSESATLSAALITVIFANPSTGELIEKRLPLMITIGKLKAMALGAIGALDQPPTALRLFYRQPSAHGAGFELEMESDSSPLSDYLTIDAKEIQIRPQLP